LSLLSLNNIDKIEESSIIYHNILINIDSFVYI